MKIAVVGLGLIGGSLAKSIKKNTSHTCYGLDTNEDTIKKAISCGAIDKAITVENLCEVDVSIICLFPNDTINFIKENMAFFKKKSIITDICGVKGAVVHAVEDIAIENGCEFIGGHPMAGREFSGFDYSTDTLFDKASFILTPTEKTSDKNLQVLLNLAKEIGFLKTVISNCEEHDKVIAFTSQLAHVVSSAYVKSPTLNNQAGFTAGSFQDLTRVAKLNEEMWSSLFMLNRQPLIEEIDHIISELNKYKGTLLNGDYDTLKTLLKEGRILKENSTSK